ncbi:hypothetical protein G4B88_020706 [Cannabis sativa]|uniref:Uncharacterized protein n=1 Tax=Cannabis sativa TaxID=3483 RepID=A0A7J6HN05_CANSA|nr:hypothetical protein G4B88_020706 [Cannabis sativa]
MFNIKISPSDHSPLLLELQVGSAPTHEYRFKFENWWMTHQGCEEIIRNCWDRMHGHGIEEKIEECGRELLQWGKDAFGSFASRIKSCNHIPNNSVISKSSWLLIPLGSFQSKWYNKNASGSSTLISPNDIPGHILLPAPNGIYSKLFPLKSILLSRNLSGIKLSGSIQYLGSLPIAHALTMILPLITHFSLLSLGSNNGEEGCNLRVSFTIDFKYFKSLIPASSTMPFLLNTCLTSSCAFFITLGFLIISAIAQSTIVADVSVPAVKMS